MAELYTYNSKDVVLILSGIPVSGFAEDTKIVINREDDLTSRKKGVDGDLSVEFMNMSDGTAEVSLIYGSDWDTTFDQLASAQLIVNLTLVHAKGKKVLSSAAWIEGQPDVSYGTGVESRTWTIGLQNTSLTISDTASSLFSSIQPFSA